MKLAFFWILFTCAAVWAQYFFPATDFFSSGLVVMLQFGLYKPVLFAGLVWMLIQEGTGGLAFGTMILFYLSLLAFFYLGGFFLEVRNIFFTMFLLLFMALFKIWIVSAMASLQDFVLSGQYSFEDFLVQAGVYFLVWMIIFNLYRKYFTNEPV